MRFLFCAVLLFTNVCCVANSPDANLDASSARPAPVYFSALPSKLTFAGEAVPLQYADVSEALEREMSVTMYMHSRTIQTLRAMKRYFAVIEPILKRYAIPDDFKYLCMAESGLNPNIMSSAKAAGLWQFMSSAAKDFGVETGENVDMRYDVETATQAAARYFLRSYKEYGNWTMVAASYNLGLSGVSRRAHAQGVSNYYDMFLPEETMRYVYRILSMKIVGENPAKYGFYLKEKDYLQPFKNYIVVDVSGPNLDWSAIAASYGTSYKMLRVLNPWIRSYQYENKSGKVYKLKVPKGDFRTLGY